MYHGSSLAGQPLCEGAGPRDYHDSWTQRLILNTVMRQPCHSTSWLGSQALRKHGQQSALS